MKGYVCLVVLLLAGVSMSQTSQTADEQAVLKVQQTWLSASQRKDSATLNRILADSFVGCPPGGGLVDKEMVANIPEGDTPFDHQKYADLSVKVFGTSAVVFGWLVSTKPDDKSAGMRFAMFYVKRAGEWQMVAAQLVRAADETPKMEQ